MRSDNSLPPGPPNPVLQTFGYTRDAYGWLYRNRDKYGDIFTARVVNGTVVVVGNPAGAQTIFSADADTFVPFASTTMKPLIGGNSILFLTGQRHKRERKLLVPPFHGERMRAYGDIIRDATLNTASHWIPGTPMPFQTSTQAISLEVIIRAVFGIEEQSRVDETRNKIIEFASELSPLLLFFPFLQRSFGGYGPFARFQRMRAELTALLQNEIDTRRRAADPGSDILSLLLAARHEDGSAMSNEELHDELITLVFAGHETTGIALAWALYWLLRNPDCMSRLMAEIDTLGREPLPEALARLPYLDCVVHETLRLHPIVPDIPRELVRPLELEGYTIPAGVGVAVATTLVHDRADIYPEPRRFKPERFLERKFSPFEYMPFGGGFRRCIGAAFATYEMKIVLGTILSRYRLVLANQDEVRPARRNVVLGPETGVPVMLIGPRSRKVTHGGHVAPAAA